MNLAFLIYIAEVLANINALAWLVFFVGVVWLVVRGMFNYLSTEPIPQSKFFVPMLVAAALIGSFTPKKETIYMMVGAQLMQDVAATPEAARISDRLLTLIEVKLDEAIDQARTEPESTEEE